jgi:hypothetical protein
VILIMMKGGNERAKKFWANGEVLDLITKRSGI